MMKNSIIAIFVIALSYFTLSAQCVPTNLIIDPSFEIGGPTFEDGCSTTPEDPCVWQVNDGGEIVSGIAYDGDYSWKTNGGSATQEPIALSPNTTYALSCWVNTATTAPYGIAIRSNTETLATGAWEGPTDGWEKISIAFTTGTENLNATIELACYTSVAYFDFFELCEGVLLMDEETLLNNVSISPNPSNGLVHINFDSLASDHKTALKVFTASGVLVFENKDIHQENYRLHLNQAPGLYFIEIRTGKEKHTFKLLKE